MKVWNWMFLCLTMMIFLEFVGISTGMGATLNYFGININNSQLINSDVGSSPFYNFIFGNDGVLIALLVGGAVVIGFLTKSFSVELVTLPVVTLVFVKFIQTGWRLINIAQSTNQQWLIAIITIIFAPLSVLYVVSAVEWFRGND